MDSDRRPLGDVIDPIRAHTVVEELEKRLGIRIETAAGIDNQVDFAGEEAEPPD
jgi:hypothetical protein